MSRLDRRTSISSVKLLMFLVVTALLTALLAALIANVNFSKTHEYTARFSDGTSLVKGDDVRIAGVRVGNVKSIRVGQENTADVTIRVDADVTLTHQTRANLRYRNMIGQRYISLSEGTEGSPTRLQPGATIDLENTAPALDLTDLFGGFQPLFQALSPEDTNQLAYELIQVFQGESGTVESLLNHTASVTTTLADRDELIGSVIDNLTTVLAAFNERDTELSTAITTLQQLITGLKDDRETLTGSLDDIAQITTQTADLLTEARPALASDIKHLRRLTAKIGTRSERARLNDTLQTLPIKIDRLGRAGEYGSFMNLFVCDVGVDSFLPGFQGLSGARYEGADQSRKVVLKKRIVPTGEAANRCR